MKTWDRKNGVAVHAWNEGHRVNWEGVEVLECEQNYRKRRTLEAIWIKKTKKSNLDCGMMLNQIWSTHIDYIYNYYIDLLQFIPFFHCFNFNFILLLLLNLINFYYIISYFNFYLYFNIVYFIFNSIIPFYLNLVT